MPHRTTSIPCGLSVLFLATSCALFAADAFAEESRPNFVVVLADDLGYGDLHCYGHEVIRSPNLDRFAAEGVKLTHCYAASANCSPSRAGLMTGRTPYRVGIHNWISWGSPMHVRRREVTVATLLQRAGYATCHVGKWHLNGGLLRTDQPQPSEHGFDHWFATQNNALPNHRNPDNFVRNGRAVGQLEGYAAHVVVDEAVDWLTTKRDESRPFFLFVCFHEPHEPIATDPKYAKLYPSDDPSYSAHHGNVTQMDDAFGRLMKTLDDSGLRDDTFVFFTSDNGPAITSIHPHGSSGPLRDKKGSVYEGGIRVPGLVRWPGHAEPGTVSDTPVCGVDLLPTLCEIAGIDVPTDRAIDGTSFLPALEGKPIERKTPLYWQFNRARSGPKVALRVGNAKVLATLTGPELGGTADVPIEESRAIKNADLKEFDLYDLQADVAESTDLAGAQADRLGELVDVLRPLYREIREESPVWPDWTSPRYESQRIEWPAYRKR